MKIKLKMEMAFKKMPIEHAIKLLQHEQAQGATHATVRIRWEAPR